MNQLRAGAALSYVNVVVYNLLTLAFTPLLLRSLGQAAYGLYALLGAFVAYLGVLDLGLGNAIVRYVAKFRAEGNAAAEGALLRACLRIYAGIAAGTLALGAVVLPNLGRLFGATLSAAELADARGLFALMTLNLAVSFPLGAFAAVITAHERFVFLRALTLVRIVVRIGLLVVLLLLGYKALAIVVVDTCLNVAVGLAHVVYVRVRLRVRTPARPLEPGFLREVFSYSAFVFINLVVDQVFWRIGHVVLGATSGTAAVAVFAVAMQCAQYFKQFPLAVSSVFLPRITGMVVGGAREEDLLAVFVRTARVQLVVLLWVLGGFALFGREFLGLWAGPAYDGAWLTALVVMVPLTVPLAQSVGIHILQAKNMHAFRSLLYLAIAAANVPLCVVFARRWGVLGAALATAASFAAGHVVAMNIYYRRRVGLDIPRFVRLAAAGLVPAALVAFAVGWPLTLIPGHSWTMLVFRGSVFTGAYAGAMLWFGLNGYERGLLGAVLGRGRGARARGEEPAVPAAEASTRSTP
jgi:O-antigen/teichoic acid export membrane protein